MCPLLQTEGQVPSVIELARQDWSRAEAWQAKAALSAAVREERPAWVASHDATAVTAWNKQRAAAIRAILRSGKVAFMEEKALAMERPGDWVAMAGEFSVHHEWVPFLLRRRLHVVGLARRSDLDEQEVQALWACEEARNLLCANEHLPSKGVQTVLASGSAIQILTMLGHASADAWMAVRSYVLSRLRDAPSDPNTALVVGKVLHNGNMKLENKTAILNAYLQCIGGRSALELLQHSQQEVYRSIADWVKSPQGAAFNHGGGLARHGLVMA